MISIRFKVLRAEAVIPAYAHPGDAGMDLHSAVAMRIAPHSRELVPTGLAMALPEGYEAQVRPRSGLALKYGVTVLNSPGTIDAGYRGEVGVILYNSGDEPFVIQPGDRIAQMVIAAVCRPDRIETVADLDETERGAGGFGSTGVKS